MKNERRIATIDFETDPFQYGRFPKAFAVGWYEGNTYLSFWGRHQDVLKWAVKRVKSFHGIVYAHNGGKFDFLAYLLEQAGKLVWGEPVMCIGGRIVKMQFGEAELRDSYAILPAPLRAYDKGEISYDKLESHYRYRYRKEILTYLNRDVVSLHTLVTAFIADHGLRPLTAASAGMRFNKKLGTKVETFNDSQDKHYRQFYYGGLVLARKPGIHRGRFVLYDVKSAYPYAMLHGHASGCDFSFSGGNSASRIRPQSFVLVRGRASCFLRRGDDGNHYGGQGEFYITGWEYLEAIRTKQFRGKVIYVETPKETVDFRPYVNHFFDQKHACETSGDKAGRLIAKIMLNSLYGKFAQRNDRFRDYFLWPNDTPCPPGLTVEAVFDDFNLKVISRPSEGGRLYNVATAASITGFVRAMLMKAIHETDPYYCDTDSIISDKNGPAPTGVRDALGGWGVETIGDLLYIAGKKLYALRIVKQLANSAAQASVKGYYWDGKRAWKIASKGCRLKPEEMKALCQGRSVHYQNDAPCYSLLNSPFFVQRTIRATAIPAMAR